MKLEIDKLEIDSVGGDDSIEATVDASSMPFFFELTSKHFYSDRIGSIVRELTSNASDARKEAKNTEPVLVKLEYNIENDAFQFTVEDFGVGMDSERISKVFNQYLSSTKRDSNDQIGGYGLGSKSPLSYQDSFEVITRKDGIEYNFIYFRSSDNGVPGIDSTYGKEIVEVTRTVTVPQQELDSDMNPVGYLYDNEGHILTEEKTITQKETRILGTPTTKENGTKVIVDIKEGDLHKFEKAIITQLCYFDDVYYSGNLDVEGLNNFKLYEKTNFIFKNHNQYSPTLHIIIDRVAYPLDFKKVNLDEVNIAIGLKFNIGDIPVTPNRENIIYNDATIKLIQNTYKKCLEELSIHASQIINTTDDITVYFNNKSQRSYILFDNFKLYIPKNLNIGSDTKYKQFDLDIPLDIFQLVDFYINKKDLPYLEQYLGSSHNKLSLMDRSSVRYYILNKGDNVNKFTSNYIEETFDTNTNILIKFNKTFTYKQLCKLFNLNKYNEFNKRVPSELGKAKIIYAYKQLIKEIFNNNPKYNDYKPSEEWVENFKEREKLKSAAYRRLVNKTVLVRTLSGTKFDIKYNELERYKYVIYDIHNVGTTSKNLQDFRNLVSVYYDNIIVGKNSKHFKIRKENLILFIQVTETNHKKIKNLSNLVHIKQAYNISIFNRLFGDIRTYIDYFMNKNDISISKTLSNYYYKKAKRLMTFKYSFKYIQTIISDNATILKQIAVIKNLKNEEIENIYLENIRVFRILNCIETTYNISYLSLLVKNLKITKLNENLYKQTFLSYDTTI